eukprot:COSAG06_NODE_5850_length_3246_cov_3.260248_5_plen_59_part_00
MFFAGNELDAATVFTSIALFENMKDPLSRLPDRQITIFLRHVFVVKMIILARQAPEKT